MSRIRTIKPEFCTSEQVVDCSPTARLLFVTMWCFCDDAGRHPLSWKRLKMECFPGDDFTCDDIKSMVCELWAADLIECFEYNGMPVLQVKTWEKHQKIEKPSYKYGPLDEEKNPLPFDDHSTIDPRTVGDRSASPHPRNGMEWNGMESYCPVADESTTSPEQESEVLLVYPCNGDQKTWGLTEKHVSAWSENFPGLDVLGECKKALAWVQANNRKTAKGMPRFLVGWLSRANDRQRASPKKHGPMSMDELDEQVEKLKAERCQSP